ncbi:MAG: 2OG-Fe(II) oxygenase family protein [Candidatus Woesearchaeota archaeon]
MTLEYIKKEYLHEDFIAATQKQFSEQKPYPYIAIPDFFDEKELEAITEAFLEETFYEKSSDLFQFKQTQDFKSVTQEKLVAFRDFLYSKAFIDYMKKLSGLDLSYSKADIFCSLYEDTDYLLCHDDQIDTRKIAYLIYLTDLEEKDGGALEIYESKEGKPTHCVEKIYPKRNTIVFFEVSERSFHAVEEVMGDAQRIAITGWWHGN